MRNLSFVVLLVTVSAAMALPFGKYGLGGYGGGVGLTQNVPVVAVSPLTFGFGGGSKKSGGAAPAPAAPAPNVVVVPAPAAPAPAPVPASPAAPAASPSEGGPQIASYRSSAIVNAPIFVQTERLQPVQQFTSQPIMSNFNMKPIMQNVPVQGGETQAVVEVNAPEGNFPALTIQAPQAVSESIPRPTYTLRQNVASAILGSTQQAPTQYNAFTSNFKPIMSNLNLQPILQNVPVQGGEMQAVVDVNAPQGNFPALNIQAPQAVSESIPQPTYTLQQSVASAILGSTQQAPTQYQSFMSNVKPIMSNLNMQPIMQNVPVQGGEMQAVVDVNAPQGNFPALNIQAPQAVSESMPSPTYRLEQNVASAILGSTQQAPTQYQSFTSNIKPIMSNLNLQPIMQNVPVQGGEMQAVVDVNAPQGNFPALNVQAPQAVSESMPSPTYRLEQNVASAILGSTQQAPTQYQSFTSNFGRAAVMAGSKS